MRSEFSFQAHKEKSISSCCRSWVVLARQDLMGYSYMISPHLCKSNYCEICRRKNLYNRRKQLFEVLKGERWRLLTLTFKNHEVDKTEQFVKAHGMVKKFIQRLRREYGSFKYARVFEVHASGFPHIHFIINMYVPIKFIINAWRDLGGGHVEIREPRCSICKGVLPCVEHGQKKYVSSKSAARYLTEEIEKKKQDPYSIGAAFWMSNVRSIMTSRNLPLKKLPTSGEWYYLRGAPDLKDAMYEYERLVYDYEYNGGVRPSCDFGKTKIMVGAGYRERPPVKFNFGIEMPAF